jgi:hypothetical protein
MKKNNSGSIILGIILVTLGLLFLLDNLDFDIDVWHYLGKYWPVILILIGVNQILKYSGKNE